LLLQHFPLTSFTFIDSIINDNFTLNHTSAIRSLVRQNGYTMERRCVCGILLVNKRILRPVRAV